MRTRTAKKLAQRIDLGYFKRAHPLRRWRMLLSIALPALALIYFGGMAAAGNRASYSPGPLTSAHAFAETRCEACHVRTTIIRAHATDAACTTCHDGPPHQLKTTTASVAPMPACVSCHREHDGREALVAAPDRSCIGCHSGQGRAAAQRAEAISFPDQHPRFTTEAGARDEGTIKFNHQVHAKADLRGPNGPETLACATCHQPQLVAGRARRRMTTGLMRPLEYERDCARCHQLFFDERIDAPAPHEEPKIVMEFVRRALREHITAHPDDLTRRDGPPRRLPLNFPRPDLPPARTPDEWVARRTAAADQLLWEKTCVECHAVTRPSSSVVATIAASNVRREWMPRAAFDHTPHLMVRCESCHAARESRVTSDVLMPPATACASCHAPGRGAPDTCATCHRYHDWSQARPVQPTFDLGHFR